MVFASQGLSMECLCGFEETLTLTTCINDIHQVFMLHANSLHRQRPEKKSKVIKVHTSNHQQWFLQTSLKCRLWQHKRNLSILMANTNQQKPTQQPQTREELKKRKHTTNSPPPASKQCQQPLNSSISCISFFVPKNKNVFILPPHPFSFI